VWGVDDSTHSTSCNTCPGSNPLVRAHGNGLEIWRDFGEAVESQSLPVGSTSILNISGPSGYRLEYNDGNVILFQKGL
jgi:hypothetical protein